MVGSGVFDVAAMNNYGYPAAIIRPSNGDRIETIDDLMDGTVVKVNSAAEKLGLNVGITGRAAVNML